MARGWSTRLHPTCHPHHDLSSLIICGIRFGLERRGPSGNVKQCSSTSGSSRYPYVSPLLQNGLCYARRVLRGKSAVYRLMPDTLIDSFLDPASARLCSSGLSGAQKRRSWANILGSPQPSASEVSVSAGDRANWANGLACRGAQARTIRDRGSMRRTHSPGYRDLSWFDCYATSLRPRVGSRWSLDEREPEMNLIHLSPQVSSSRLYPLSSTTCVVQHCTRQSSRCQSHRLHQHASMDGNASQS
jgi:hypothetical protein